MADIELVIKIDEELYDELKTISKEEWSDERLGAYQWIIVKGTLLPKNHGRLIDADELIRQYKLDEATKYGNKNAKQQAYSYSTMMLYEIADMIDDAPIIIEADSEENE